MELLQAPLPGHQFTRQPIQQFRMGRRQPVHSEIVGRRSECLTEMPLPDPVRHHAGGERILRGDQPSGQAAATLIVFIGAVRQGSSAGKKSRQRG